MKKLADTKQYPMNQSPFYKLSSPNQAARLFKMELTEFERLVGVGAGNYENFDIEHDNGKIREIESPKRRTQALHKKACKFLTRIETPDYLHSALKGRSYLTNARAHIGEGATIKVDIRSFFKSVKRASVFNFFVEHMNCPRDVAGILASLFTYNGHLSTGSSVSPILSYYAHKDMFDEIYSMCEERGFVMSVYVDDIAISGDKVSRKFMYEVRKVIAADGLRSHKTHYFRAGRPRIVTGAVVGADDIHLPSRRHKRIHEDYLAFKAAETVEEKLKIITPLISRVHEAAQIDKAWLPKARNLIGLRRKLEVMAIG